MEGIVRRGRGHDAGDAPVLLGHLDDFAVEADLHAELVHQTLQSQGAVVMGSTPAEFRSFLVQVNADMGRLIKSINLSLD